MMEKIALHWVVSRK